MKPYWTSAGGNLTIYHGDARDVLPELDLSGVDLVLTDPPYGIDGGRGNINRKRGKGNYTKGAWADTPEYVRAICVPVIRECIDRVGRVILTPGILNVQSYPQATDIGCFWSTASVGYTSWGRNAVTPILFYGKDPRAGKGQSPTGHQVNHARSVDWHPCPKTLDAWQWLLCKGSLEGETLLDPFAGAFTTLLAAQRTGRKAIGIEIEEYYCERGADRLSQTAFELPPTEPAQTQKEFVL